MARDLEAPADTRPAWGVLYRARGMDEVAPERPYFTGDVFTNVPVAAPRSETKNKSVMVIQHPCAMRPDGVNLAESILVAEVRRFPILPPDRWNTNGKLMPLPGLLSPAVASSRANQAALFDNTFHVHPEDLVERIACLSPRGVNLLLQRWVYHSSRVVIPTFDFDAAVGPAYEEADIVEDWCTEALAGGRTLVESQLDAAAWLSESDSGLVRRKALESPQLRSNIRRQAQGAAATWRRPDS